MPHVVLLGDSIFDNARYVPDRPPVIRQVRDALPPGWTASLLAVDGHTVQDVAWQLARLPADATHLVMSVGGNDALGASGLLNEPAVTVGEGLAIIREELTGFATAYGAMIEAVLARGLPLAVCTIYDAIPGMGPAELAGLAGFNDVILRSVFARGLPVIDLRLVCSESVDYSPLSRIEPSQIGGGKIADAIAGMLKAHDFAAGRTAVYR